MACTEVFYCFSRKLRAGRVERDGGRACSTVEGFDTPSASNGSSGAKFFTAAEAATALRGPRVCMK